MDVDGGDLVAVVEDEAVAPEDHRAGERPEGEGEIHLEQAAALGEERRLRQVHDLREVAEVEEEVAPLAEAVLGVPAGDHQGHRHGIPEPEVGGEAEQQELGEEQGQDAEQEAELVQEAHDQRPLKLLLEDVAHARLRVAGHDGAHAAAHGVGAALRHGARLGPHLLYHAAHALPARRRRRRRRRVPQVARPPRGLPQARSVRCRRSLSARSAPRAAAAGCS